MASGSRHPWEEAAHPWEAAEYSAGSPDSDSDLEVDPATAAATELLDHLVDLYLTSTISARSLCSLCFWAAKAGICHEDFSRYAHKPDDPNSGNY